MVHALLCGKHTHHERGCIETVQRLRSPMALLSASALRWPVTTTTTSRLSSTVATPTVSAMRGTAAMSLLKKRAFARIVSYASVLMRVREARDEPGVLCYRIPGMQRGGEGGRERMAYRAR